MSGNTLTIYQNKTMLEEPLLTAMGGGGGSLKEIPRIPNRHNFVSENVPSTHYSMPNERVTVGSNGGSFIAQKASIIIPYQQVQTPSESQMKVRKESIKGSINGQNDQKLTSRNNSLLIQLPDRSISEANGRFSQQERYFSFDNDQDVFFAPEPEEKPLSNIINNGNSRISQINAPVFISIPNNAGSLILNKYSPFEDNANFLEAIKDEPPNEITGAEMGLSNNLNLNLNNKKRSSTAIVGENNSRAHQPDANQNQRKSIVAQRPIHMVGASDDFMQRSVAQGAKAAASKTFAVRQSIINSQQNQPHQSFKKNLQQLDFNHENFIYYQVKQEGRQNLQNRLMALKLKIYNKHLHDSSQQRESTKNITTLLYFFGVAKRIKFWLYLNFILTTLLRIYFLVFILFMIIDNKEFTYLQFVIPTFVLPRLFYMGTMFNVLFPISERVANCDRQLQKVFVQIFQQEDEEDTSLTAIQRQFYQMQQDFQPFQVHKTMRKIFACFIITPPEFCILLMPKRYRLKRTVIYFMCNFIYQSIETVICSPILVIFCAINQFNDHSSIPPYFVSVYIVTGGLGLIYLAWLWIFTLALFRMGKLLLEDPKKNHNLLKLL